MSQLISILRFAPNLQMNSIRMVFFALSLSFFSYGIDAKIEGRSFNTPQQEALYQTLIQELRCLVCQNQNLADSNAELAQDLREKTYKMVVADKSRSEIVDYMVARYGDFVMYKPPLDARTLILWIGPFGILLAAIMIAVVNLRKRSSNPSENTGKDSDESSKGTNDEYQQQARDLLKDKDSKSNSRSDENKK